MYLCEASELQRRINKKFIIVPGRLKGKETARWQLSLFSGSRLGFVTYSINCEMHRNTICWTSRGEGEHIMRKLSTCGDNKIYLFLILDNCF
jgi:hypothetical protein